MNWRGAAGRGALQLSVLINVVRRACPAVLVVSRTPRLRQVTDADNELAVCKALAISDAYRN